MAVSLDSWIDDQVDTRGLSGYARQIAYDALRSDATIEALYDASYAADYRQSGLQWGEGDEDLREVLVSARRSCDDALGELAAEVIEDAVTGVDVHGHTVDLRHATSLDCEECGESVEAYYLGTDADGMTGWVCGHCGATVPERASEDSEEYEGIST